MRHTHAPQIALQLEDLKKQARELAQQINYSIDKWTITKSEADALMSQLSSEYQLHVDAIINPVNN